MEELEREMVEVRQKVSGLEQFERETKKLLSGPEGLVIVVTRIDERVEVLTAFCNRFKNGMGKIMVSLVVSGIIAALGSLWYLGH